MSQIELHRRSGIRPNTINALYNGYAERISFDHIDRICEALGCSVGELLERTPGAIRKTGNELILEPHGLRKTEGEMPSSSKSQSE